MKKYLLHQFAFALAMTFILAASGYAQKNPPKSLLGGNLKFGRYDVGFKTIFTYDASRPSLKTDIGTDKSEGREMQISVWYPAKFNKQISKMLFEEYIFLLAQELDFTPLDEEKKQTGVDKFMREPLSFGADRAKLEALRKMETSAVRDAPNAKGKFQLIIFAHAAPASQSIMCEYLASHGFIVGAIPSKGASVYEYRLSVPNLEAMIADIKFVEETLKDFPSADKNNLGLIGMSNGAMGALGRHLSNPHVKAIVSLDGSVGDKGVIPALKRFKDYNPSALNARLLHLYTPNNPNLDFSLIDSYQNAERYLVSIPRMRHADFISYGMLEHFVPKIWGNSPGDTKAGFEWVCRFTLHFLKVYLKKNVKSKKFLKNSPDENGIPPGLLSVKKKVI